VKYRTIHYIAACMWYSRPQATHGATACKCAAYVQSQFDLVELESDERASRV
tara:strand:+ start:999 stop:1154 length:156 start_codon:yes stop_codon:yes gene_type:complete